MQYTKNSEELNNKQLLETEFCMKKFLVSIDTEGDNLWKWVVGKPITTENAKFLPRFQELCEKYGFKPTYLTNYEMAKDPFFANYFKKKSEENLCEIGMHLHAWNSPPDFELEIRNDVPAGASYITEYPIEIIEKKVDFLTNLLENTFETDIIIHRSGRWATNQEYFKILDKRNYKVDCSVTPMIDWTKTAGQSPNSCGTNYAGFPKTPYIIKNTDILEIPVTIRENHRLRTLENCGIKKSIKRIYEAKKGYGPLWLRPKNTKENLQDLLYLTDKISREPKTDYLMFMLHSSEFMPGGSPTFTTDESIEHLYENLEMLFKHISKNFSGCNFKEYYEKHK